MTAHFVIGVPESLTALAIAGALLAAPAAAQPADPPIPGGMWSTRATPAGGLDAQSTVDWLTWLNAWRDAAHLPPVSENVTWSAGGVAHSRYCVRNGLLTHYEDPSNPHYTPEGYDAGRNGNVAAHSSAAASDLWPIDAWITGPFHAVGMLDPKLATVGYGIYRANGDAGGWIRAAATLDVLRGRTRPGPYGFPIVFPANGAVVPIPSGCSSAGACYSGNEHPNPLSACPGYTAPAGLPIIVQMGTGSLSPVVTASSLTRADGTALAHCVFTELTYTNPVSSDQSLGRSVLGSRDAVVLVPRAPLPAGWSYTVSLTINGTTYTSTFAVSSSGLPSGSQPPPPPPEPPPPAPPGDADGDGLPDEWERRFGLDPASAAGPDGAGGDPDGDGKTNLQEYQEGTHPRGFVITYLAEGATSELFATRVAIVNPTATPALVLARFQKADATTVPKYLVVGPRSRATIDVGQEAGLATAEFSTLVEADVQVVVDRTMTWPATGPQRGYGAHSERGILTRTATTWYLAEGATLGNFDLFYLIQNPNETAAEVEVTYLLPSGPLAPRRYTVAAQSRFNIWVDQEGPALANAEVSAVLRSVNGVPVIVERAMYLTTPGQFFGAGHESAGVTAPALSWFLAEGATGEFFDLFILVANPNPTVAQLEARYLLESGDVITKTYTVGPNSRYNIWVDFEDPRLANVAVSTTVRSTNGVPVIVERAMWWPGTLATWYEAHNSPGATETGLRWAVADGEVGGPAGAETYLLVANTSPTEGRARVTLLFADGTPEVAKEFVLPPTSRTNVAVAAEFPAAGGKVFGAVVESVGTAPAQIVVERAVYYNAGGVFWAAGTNALATRLP